MTNRLRIAIFTALIVAQYSISQEFEAINTASLAWFKGNTHTLGMSRLIDSSNEEILQWYKSYGYNFIVLAEEHVFSDLKPLSILMTPEFTIIPGQGLVSYLKQPKFAAITAMNAKGPIKEQTDENLLVRIQKNINAIREAGAVPIIEHPNFLWSLDKETLLDLSNWNLLEIYNGSPNTNNEGGDRHLSMEEVWDFLLSNGKRVYGIASDDAMWFKGERSQGPGGPGRGWVYVLARRLEASEIAQSLDSGLFYASTGVELEKITIQPKRIEVRYKKNEGLQYWIDFIGTGGKVLKQTRDNPGVYELEQNERYVRSVVRDSAGHKAWVQPVFIKM